MITAQMQQQYERALARADEEGVKILVSWSDAQGRAWKLSSPKHAAGTGYVVRLGTSTKILSCNCFAGMRGDYCKHRARVRELLLEEQRAAQDTDAIAYARMTADAEEHRYTILEQMRDRRDAELAAISEQAAEDDLSTGMTWHPRFGRPGVLRRG